MLINRDILFYFYIGSSWSIYPINVCWRLYGTYHWYWNGTDSIVSLKYLTLLTDIPYIIIATPLN